MRYPHSRRRTQQPMTALLFNRNTASFLFMTQESPNIWIPDIDMLEIYRIANPPLRIYKVAETTTYITVDNNGIQRTWTTLDETATVRQIVEGPWISNDEIYQDFPVDDINPFDTWIRERCSGPGRTEWDDHLRPQVDRPQREPFILLTLFEIPTAPPCLPEHHQHLPSHVAALLIAHAVSTGATCPITMEPIDANTATTTPCGHVFTESALRHWISTQRHTCPECRAPL